LAVSEIHAQEQRLSAANAAAAEQITHGATPEKIIAADTVFPGRSIEVLRQKEIPGWLKDGFAGLVSDGKQLSLRAANAVTTPHGQAMVVSVVPFDQKFLGRIAGRLGALTLTRADIKIDTSSGGGVTVTSAEDDPSLDPQRMGLFTAGTVSEPRSS